MKQPTDSFILYPTAKACLEEYFGGPIPKRGWWEWISWDGTYHRDPMATCLQDIRKLGYWGFVRNKDTIHMWIGKRANRQGVLKMLAHEIGHKQRPYHRSLDEERKANKYGKVAADAFWLLLDAERRMRRRLPDL